VPVSGATSKSDASHVTLSKLAVANESNGRTDLHFVLCQTAIAASKKQRPKRAFWPEKLPESEGFRDRRYDSILPRKRTPPKASNKVQNQCKMSHFGDGHRQ
jgi:hypothetical protein